jgi:hypothetical protein
VQNHKLFLLTFVSKNEIFVYIPFRMSCVYLNDFCRDVCFL